MSADAAEASPAISVDNSTGTTGARSRGDDAREAVATNLRRYRLARGFSLRELAEATASSKGLLSQIENGLANPSLHVLGRVADALGLTVVDLLRAPLLAPDVIRGPGIGVAVTRDVAIRTLFESPERRRMELSEATMPAHTRSSKNAHGAGSIEYAYVVEGAVTLQSEDWSVTLEQGDAVRFSAGSEHVYLTDAHAARVLTLVGLADD